MKLKKKDRPKFETFNDGYACIYITQNVSQPGFEPIINHVLRQKYPFSYQTIGVKRAYEAAQAQAKLEELIKIPLDRGVSTQCIVGIDNIKYEVKLVQHKYDTHPATTWLSLVRLEADYDRL